MSDNRDDLILGELKEIKGEVREVRTQQTDFLKRITVIETRLSPESQNKTDKRIAKLESDHEALKTEVIQARSVWRTVLWIGGALWGITTTILAFMFNHKQ